MKIGTLLLCRYNSTRLPGKILRNIGDKPILQYLYEKLQLVVSKESIVVTTSEESSDDIIESYCKQNGINVFRGSLENVAGRFLDAGLANNFDFITRINGDAPFINMNLYAKMLVACRTNQYDFISNVDGRTYPVGMSTEVLRTSFYQSIQKEIQADPYFYEHVTSFLYANPEIGKRFYFENKRYPELRALHLAVDTPQDYEFAQRMHIALGDNYQHADFEDICEALKEIKADYETEGLEWTHDFNHKKLVEQQKKGNDK